MKLFYSFFHHDVGLKNPKKLKFTEVSFSDRVVGRYRDLYFVVSEKGNGGFVEFVVEFGGESKFDGNSLKLSVEPSEEVVYDYVPALLGEIVIIEDLMKRCDSIVEMLRDREKDVVRRVSRMFRTGNDLEGLLNDITSHHSELFEAFLEFKEISGELFSAIIRYEKLCESLSIAPRDFRREVEKMKYFESRFDQTLAGIRDVLNMISVKLDTLRNREYLELQRRTSALQAATAVIEFVAVFYYTLKIWSHFEHVKANPITFSLLMAFTTLIVLYTDAMGEVIRDRRITRKFVMLTLAIAFVVAMMIAYPISK